MRLSDLFGKQSNNLQTRWARLQTSGTARAGLWLMVTGLLGSFLNYLYHFALGRMLLPGDYASLVSFMALFNLVLTPFRVNRALISDFTTRLTISGDIGQVKDLLIRYSLLLAGLAAVLSLGVLATYNGWLNYFHLTSPWPLVLWLAAIVSVILLQAAAGVLQGQQSFIALGWTALLGDVVQLLGGVIFVTLGWGLAGAIGGLTAGNIVMSVAIGLVLALRFASVPRRASGISLRQSVGYALQVSVGAVAMILLTNMDVLLARYFFSAELAGSYSAASTLGNAVLFVSSPLLVMLFPKAGEQHARGQAGTHTLRRAMLVVLVMVFGVALLYWLLPDLIVNTLYGGRYAAAASLLSRYGLAMAGFSVVAVLRTHYQARHDWRFVWLMLFFVVLQAVLLVGLHLDAQGFVTVLLISSWSLAAVSELWLGGLRGKDAH